MFYASVSIDFGVAWAVVLKCPCSLLIRVHLCPICGSFLPSFSSLSPLSPSAAILTSGVPSLRFGCHFISTSVLLWCCFGVALVLVFPTLQSITDFLTLQKE